MIKQESYWLEVPAGGSVPCTVGGEEREYSGPLDQPIRECPRCTGLTKVHKK